MHVGATCGYGLSVRIMEPGIFFLSLACSRNKGVSDYPLKHLVDSPRKDGLVKDGLEGVPGMPEHDFLPIQNFDFVEFYEIKILNW